MTWVRYDDNVGRHPKVRALDDATYRLWREAIEWCSQNLTDGVILAHELGLTCIRASAPRARKLVEGGLWHRVGDVCESEKCPPSGPDGWVIHDFWDYQRKRVDILAEREATRERQRRWLEKAREGKKANGSANGVSDASVNASHDASDNGNPAPPRPAPPRKGGGGLGPLPAAVGGVAAAGSEAKDQLPAKSPPVPSNGRPDLAATRAAIADARAKARRPPPAAGAMDALRAATPNDLDQLRTEEAS